MLGKPIISKNDDIIINETSNSPKMVRKESELDEIAKTKILDIKDQSEEKEMVTELTDVNHMKDISPAQSIIDPVDKTKSFMDSSANLMYA